MDKQSSGEFMNPNYTEQKEETGDAATQSVPVAEEVKVKATVDKESNDSTPSLDSPEPAKVVTQAATDEESSEAKNFKALRELKNQAEQERDAALRQYREMQTTLGNQQQAQQQEQADNYDINLHADDLVEGKHLSKVTEQLKQVQKQFKQYQTQASNQQVEARLKSRYSDFDNVVSKENLELLVAREPELARGLNANPDLFSKAVTAYTIIKDLGIAENTSSHQSPKKSVDRARVSEKIDENLRRPQVAASMNPQSGESALSKANSYADSYSKEEMDSAYKEMLKRANG